MKFLKVVVVICVAVLLAVCVFINNRLYRNDNYEKGLEKLEAKNYTAAKNAFKKAIDEGCNEKSIEDLITVIDEYNTAKKSYDSGNYDSALEHLNLIPALYADYAIKTDIDSLKDYLEKYKNGIDLLNAKNYTGAEAIFKELLDKDSKQNNVKNVYSIVSEYNLAKPFFDTGDYNNTLTHLNKIPPSYINYPISADIDYMKNHIKAVNETAANLAEAASLVKSRKYDQAEQMLLKIDTNYTTADQNNEIAKYQTQIRLGRKNQSSVPALNALITSYARSFVNSVNSGDFSYLESSRTLYPGSSIYNTQKSYINTLSQKPIFEQYLDARVESVSWTSDTTCVIKTVEKYRVDNRSTGKVETKTLRYTYDVIQTSDGSVYLKTIKKTK